MGREVKRVPLDFDYPLNKVWYGYLIRFCCDDCDSCKDFAKRMDIPYTSYECPDFRNYFKVNPPYGEGYQLWENTTEGSPISPVFKSAKEFSEWCENNATAFADIKISKEEWLKLAIGTDVVKCTN